MTSLLAFALHLAPWQVSTTEQPLINGTPTTAHPAVGALVRRRTHCQQTPLVECTVTLIAPDVVLTAGHCVARAGERRLAVQFGSGVRAGGAIAVVRHVIHPDYESVSSDFDLALLQLAQPVDIEPLALGAVSAPMVGSTVHLVGFGEVANGQDDGLKRAGTGLIRSVEARTFSFTPDPSMTCRGDSGGPALLEGEDGGFAIVGVTSAGDLDCRTHGVDTRVDAALDTFIRPTLAAFEPAGSLTAGPLCTAPCAEDADCPSGFLCQLNAADEPRCQAPQLDVGDFTDICETDDQCASGHCAPWADECACYTPCSTHEPPSTSANDAGCRLTPGRSHPFGGWFICIVWGILGRWRSADLPC